MFGIVARQEDERGIKTVEDNRKTELNTLFCQLSSQGKAEFMDYLRNLEREQNEKKNDTTVSSRMQKL